MHRKQMALLVAVALFAAMPAAQASSEAIVPVLVQTPIETDDQWGPQKNWQLVAGEQQQSGNFTAIVVRIPLPSGSTVIDSTTLTALRPALLDAVLRELPPGTRMVEQQPPAFVFQDHNLTAPERNALKHRGNLDDMGTIYGNRDRLTIVECRNATACTNLADQTAAIVTAELNVVGVLHYAMQIGSETARAVSQAIPTTISPEQAELVLEIMGNLQAPDIVNDILDLERPTQAILHSPTYAWLFEDWRSYQQQQARIGEQWIDEQLANELQLRIVLGLALDVHMAQHNIETTTQALNFAAWANIIATVAIIVGPLATYLVARHQSRSKQ